jgi:hypothetical protein
MAYPMIFDAGIPRIPVELLWDFSILIALISGVFMILIFIFRHRISAVREQMEYKKRQLAPMISQYLFYPQDKEADPEAAFKSMQEFRAKLNTPTDRALLTELLMELVQDVSGEARRRLLDLYQDLGLQEDAYRKLKSRNWEKVSQGILELSQMQVTQAYYLIRRFVNDSRSILRKQAQQAMVGLSEEGIGYFMDTARHPVSDWQQMELMEILRRKDRFRPPNFKNWLTSENDDIVLLSLRLIRTYHQINAAEPVMDHLRHTSKEIRMAALKCIRDFRYVPARKALKKVFETADPDCRILILDSLQQIPDTSDIPWIETQASENDSFLVRGKAKSVLASLRSAETTGFTAEKSQAGPYGSGIEPSDNDFPGSPSERNIRGRLKPDFGAISPQTKGSGAQGRSSTPVASLKDPVTLPEEQWDAEYEHIFDTCFREALIEALSSTPVSGVLPEESTDFLPHVTDQSPKTTAMNPHEPCPEWLLRLEVQAEIIFSDAGYARMLKEILLEELEETARVLDTDFIPWVTSSVREDGTDDLETGENDDISRVWPEFGVLAADITNAVQGIQQENVSVEGATETGKNTKVTYFSIFQEFFRSYDTESKLILLDEIPEIGGRKELHFLSTLFEDPEDRIRKKARNIYERLASKLGDPGQDDDHPVIPADLSAGSQTGSRQGQEGGTHQQVDPTEVEDQGYLELNFIPELEFSQAESSPESLDLKAKEMQNGYLRFLKYLNGSQPNNDE